MLYTCNPSICDYGGRMIRNSNQSLSCTLSIRPGLCEILSQNKQRHMKTKRKTPINKNESIYE